jgi:hypothetical protein
MKPLYLIRGLIIHVEGTGMRHAFRVINLYDANNPQVGETSPPGKEIY